VIRYINCLRKKPEISDDEFRRYWCDERFDALIQRVAALSGADRHAKNLTLKVQASRRLIEDRGTGEPYDGVLEYWWRDAAGLMETYESGEAKALVHEMSEYQNQFVDLSRSTAFFTEDAG
jgi:hypothetical protein